MSKKEEYANIAEVLGALAIAKNEAYGDSFEKGVDMLKLIYPNGISHDQMFDAVIAVRILDKLFRIGTNKDAFGESPYKDIAGYGILGVHHEEYIAKKPKASEGERL